LTTFVKPAPRGEHTRTPQNRILPPRNADPDRVIPLALFHSLQKTQARVTDAFPLWPFTSSRFFLPLFLFLTPPCRAFLSKLLPQMPTPFLFLLRCFSLINYSGFFQHNFLMQAPFSSRPSFAGVFSFTGCFRQSLSFVHSLRGLLPLAFPPPFFEDAAFLSIAESSLQSSRPLILFMSFVMQAVFLFFFSRSVSELFLGLVLPLSHNWSRLLSRNVGPPLQRRYSPSLGFCLPPQFIVTPVLTASGGLF